VGSNYSGNSASIVKRETDAKEIDRYGQSVAPTSEQSTVTYETEAISLNEVERSANVNVISEKQDSISNDSKSEGIRSHNIASLDVGSNYSGNSASIVKRETDAKEIDRGGQSVASSSEQSAVTSDAESLVAYETETISPKQIDGNRQSSIAPSQQARDGGLEKSLVAHKTEDILLKICSSHDEGNDEKKSISPKEIFKVERKHSEVLPIEVFRDMKNFWESSLLSEPSDIFPEKQPLYKSDDPHVHPI